MQLTDGLNVHNSVLLGKTLLYITYLPPIITTLSQLLFARSISLQLSKDLKGSPSIDAMGLLDATNTGTSFRGMKINHHIYI